MFKTKKAHTIFNDFAIETITAFALVCTHMYGAYVQNCRFERVFVRACMLYMCEKKSIIFTKTFQMPFYLVYKLHIEKHK